MIARLDEARLAELSTWCWSFHRWQGGTKSVKLSKARPLEGLDERASPRSGLSPVITTSRVAALATGGMERALWLACQRKDAAMTQDQATSRFAGVTLEDTLAVRAAVAREKNCGAVSSVMRRCCQLSPIGFLALKTTGTGSSLACNSRWRCPAWFTL